MKHKFKIGDRVQFKSWEEMVEPSFTNEMSYLCGTYATIIEIPDSKEVLLDSFSENQHDNNTWAYTLDMLKPVKKDLASMEEKNKITATAEFENIDEQIKYHEEQLAKLKAQKEKEKWDFTEDEKVILRNVPKKYKWIARNKDNDIKFFQSKPSKILWRVGVIWTSTSSLFDETTSLFNHLFQCIQWSDTEPCEFRKYI